MVCVNQIAFIFADVKLKNKSFQNMYKIHVKKSHLTSSSLGISTTSQCDVWENWKKDIYTQLYGNFVITLTQYHTNIPVYAQLVVIKECRKSPNHVVLYFKYNLPVDYIDPKCYQCNINQNVIADTGCYNNVKFYYDDTYQYKVF